MRRQRKRPSLASAGLLLIGLMPTLVLGSCSGPGRSEATDLIDRSAIQESVEEPEPRDRAEGAHTGSEAEPNRPASRGTIDSEELVGLGEFGLLPTLLQALSPSVACDPDDPFGNCQ